MGAQEGIANANAAFTAAFAAGDAARVAACYSETGWFMVPGAETFKGRTAIANAIQGLMDSGVTNVGLATAEVYDLGETAIEVGEYTLYAGDNVADQGRFMVNWQSIGGKWYLHRDMINSLKPPA
jgi:uncharacterized protein (TIGR02246 family)